MRGTSFRKSLVAAFLFISLAAIVFAEPLGVTTDQLSSSADNSTRYGSNPNAIGIQAGNVTDFGVISARAITQTWAGFYGNITAQIVLADSSGYVMYDWNTTRPSGEIYAANNTIDWNGIQCFNYTATGTYDNYAGDSANIGDYNLYGKNLSLLEQEFGLNYSEDNQAASVDGVNETFYDDTVSGTPTQKLRMHTEFYTNGQNFSAMECPTTYVYDNTGAGVQGKFEEVILWDPLRNNTIFTALIGDDAFGYDNRQHDFEMIVLEDGTKTSMYELTNYYFYVEIT